MSRGSATVLSLGLAGASALLVSATALVGLAVSERVALDGAADVTALAAADALAGFAAGEPCSVARRAAALNGAGLAGCAVSGAVVEVVVDASVLGLRASSRARAGPPDG